MNEKIDGDIMSYKLKNLVIISVIIISFIVINVLAIYSVFYIPKGVRSEGTINIKYALLEVEILEIEDNILMVKPIRDYEKFVTDTRKKRKGYEFLQTDTLAINLEKTDIKCDLEVGKIVFVNYKFVDGYEGENPRYLNTVEYLSDKQE